MVRAKLLAACSLWLGLAEVPPCAKEGTGYDDPDHSTVNGGYVADALQCQTTCAGLWFCSVFTFYPDSGACWVQGEKAIAFPMDRAVSGPKVCASDGSTASVQVLVDVAQRAAANANASGKSLSDQLSAAANAVTASAAQAGLSAKQQTQASAVAVGQVAADAGAAEGKSFEDQLTLAAGAAKSLAETANMSLQEQAGQAAIAAGGVAANAAEKRGDAIQGQLTAATNAAHLASAATGMGPEVQAEQAAAAAAYAAAAAGQDFKQIGEAAAQAASQIAADVGLSDELQAGLAANASRAVQQQTSFSNSILVPTGSSLVTSTSSSAAAATQASVRSTTAPVLVGSVADIAGQAQVAPAAESQAVRKETLASMRQAGQEAASAAEAAGASLQKQAEVAAQATATAGTEAGLTPEQQVNEIARAASQAVSNSTRDIVESKDAAAEAATKMAFETAMNSGESSEVQAQLASDASSRAAAEVSLAAGESLQGQAHSASRAASKAVAYIQSSGHNLTSPSSVAASAAGRVAAERAKAAGIGAASGTQLSMAASKEAATRVEGGTLTETDEKAFGGREEPKDSGLAWWIWLFVGLAVMCIVGAALYKSGFLDNSTKTTRGHKYLQVSQSDADEERPLMVKTDRSIAETVASHGSLSPRGISPMYGASAAVASTGFSGMGSGHGMIPGTSFNMPANPSLGMLNVGSMGSNGSLSPFVFPVIMQDNSRANANAYHPHNFEQTVQQLSYSQWQQQRDRDGLPLEVIFEVPQGATPGASVIVEVAPGFVVPTTVPQGALPGMKLCLQR